MPTTTLDPDPPRAGEVCVVCTDGDLPRKIVKTIVGEPDEDLTLNEPCIQVWIPDSAQGHGYLFHDTHPTKPAPDVGGIVA